MTRKKKKSGGLGKLLNMILGFALAGFVIAGLTHVSKAHAHNHAAESAILISAAPSEHQWIVTLLRTLGDPRDTANENSIADWITHESPWNGLPPDGALYTRNPLNTSMGEPGSVILNSKGVRQYPSMAEGVQATIDTLHDGWYADVLAQLHAGAGLTSYAGTGLLKWSNGAYSSV